MMTLGDAGHIAGAVSIGMGCAYVWRRLTEWWLKKHPIPGMGICLECRGFMSFLRCPHRQDEGDDTAALRAFRPSERS